VLLYLDFHANDSGVFLVCPQHVVIGWQRAKKTIYIAMLHTKFLSLSPLVGLFWKSCFIARCTLVQSAILP